VFLVGNFRTKLSLTNIAGYFSQGLVALFNKITGNISIPGIVAFQTLGTISRISDGDYFPKCWL
jgi:hypothetical protein